MNIDSLTFEAAMSDGRWTVRNPQLDIKVTAANRLEAIAECQRKTFKRFYEIDADNRVSRDLR